MKKCFYIFRISALFCFCLFGFSFIFNKIYYHYNWYEAFFRTSFSLLENTVWKKGFSEKKFSKIKTGMDKNEVNTILGSPLGGECEKFPCSWQYTTRKGSNDSFDRRWVSFNEKGFVAKVYRDFFID